MKKVKLNFVEGVSSLLNSIRGKKKELKELKNLGLRNAKLKEKESIKLTKAKAKNQKLEILSRYEKGKESLGEILLKSKNRQLKSRLSTEKKSLNRADKDIEKIKRNLDKVRGN